MSERTCHFKWLISFFFVSNVVHTMRNLARVNHTIHVRISRDATPIHRWVLSLRPHYYKAGMLRRKRNLRRVVEKILLRTVDRRTNQGTVLYRTMFRQGSGSLQRLLLHQFSARTLRHDLMKLRNVPNFYRVIASFLVFNFHRTVVRSVRYHFLWDKVLLRLINGVLHVVHLFQIV